MVEAIDSADADSEGGTKEVYLKIPKTVSSDSLKSLKEILLKNQGQSPVTLLFEGKKERKRLPIKIVWNEGLARQISEVLEGKDLSGVE